MKRAIALTLLLTGLAPILFFTGSDVATLLQSQHTFTSISDPGNQINCTGCHSQIESELVGSLIHTDLDCEDCHRFNGTGITFASGDGTGSTPGNRSHAAYTPRCLDCHGGNGAWITNRTGRIVHAPPAPAFNESEYGSRYSAHKPFVEDSLNFELARGENEACLACHTDWSLDIEYNYFKSIEYNLSNWAVPLTSFAYSGDRDYTTIISKTDAKHRFIATEGITCVKCHRNIYDALVNGTMGGTNEDYLTHAPIEISTGKVGHRWDTDNPWNHYRYHYVPALNRATWVNRSYCYECHNVKRYAEENPGDEMTYDLDSVRADTNSEVVHAAEALWCQTCHGDGKRKEVIDNPDHCGEGHSKRSFVDDIKTNYARTFHGDICMGCHEAAVHPPMSGRCSRCHQHGNADVYIESEPTGYAENTR